MDTWRRFQFRNEDFCPRSRKSRDCAEAYSGMPHKRSRRLTPRLGKKTIYGWKLNRRYGLITDYPDRCNHYCPTRGMGEKPSPSDENFNLSVDTAARIQEVKGSRIQATAGMVFSLDPSTPRPLGSLDPKPSALAEGG